MSLPPVRSWQDAVSSSKGKMVARKPKMTASERRHATEEQKAEQAKKLNSARRAKAQFRQNMAETQAACGAGAQGTAVPTKRPDLKKEAVAIRNIKRRYSTLWDDAKLSAGSSRLVTESLDAAQAKALPKVKPSFSLYQYLVSSKKKAENPDLSGARLRAQQSVTQSLKARSEQKKRAEDLHLYGAKECSIRKKRRPQNLVQGEKSRGWQQRQKEKTKTKIKETIKKTAKDEKESETVLVDLFEGITWQTTADAHKDGHFHKGRTGRCFCAEG
jgi:hypothetical protein